MIGGGKTGLERKENSATTDLIICESMVLGFNAGMVNESPSI
jgi:hypothetical protein